ncbi:MaoC family dehydratase [Zavarzinia sp. CC-PAN008]|uniref:MaoC family dehydratase n=1 Tax=Zavarzinia sp. CC-PAN008 TaxID=3243332 RepID=UPI003F748EE8
MPATSIPKYDSVKVGDEIPLLETKPITRTTLALYCGASGDHNPLHVDTDFAAKAGLPDVIAHGMLSMAYLGRVVTNWVPQSQLRAYSVRFTAMTQVHDVVSCSGKVVEKVEEAGEKRVKLSLEAKTQGGTTLLGDAVVALA